jgi:histidinol-phosphatase (PHP family)
MAISHDYHAHTTYSDGRFIGQMVDAAEDAGLDGVGFADHCNVSDQPSLQDRRARYGFNLDRTYERRRAGIEAAREETEVRVFDAVEIDYHPGDEDRTREFLDEAAFDYAIGSVHEVGGRNVAAWGPFEGLSDETCAAVVDDYFHRQRELVESELFEVVGHLDVVERNPYLRGYATHEQYARVANALDRSRTVPELNAGRPLAEYGEAHPRPAFLDVLLDHGIEFTAGTDAHRPDELRDRAGPLASVFAERETEPLSLLD